MLDQISQALPPMLWLTELKQVGTDVVIDGNCTTLTGLSDFVANLEASGYFKRSIEIVSTTTEIARARAGRADQVQRSKRSFSGPAKPRRPRWRRAGRRRRPRRSAVRLKPGRRDPDTAG